MNNLCEDLSKLTNIDEESIRKVLEKSIYCICDEVRLNLLENKNVAEVDIGFGKLNIALYSNDLKFKFIPSEDLINGLKSAKNNEDVFEKKLEKTVIDKILNTYKELL